MRTVLLVSSALCLASTLPAAAQDATWSSTPGTGNFNTAANWIPGAVPTGTAFFGTSSRTALSLSGGTRVGGWTFNAGASNYSFSNSQLLTFTGAGIDIQGGSATINNNSGGTTFFDNTSTAGSATITNSGASYMGFFNSSTAGSASITNNATLDFGDASTAGSATITTNSGGRSQIFQSASGGTARFILNGTGALDVSFSTTGTTAGSIEGAGNVFLGSKNLAVGGNNLSTTFSGVIQDGGFFGGTGGSLTKTGSGTLTLSGVNTYTGATTVEAGTLRAGAAGAFVGNTAYAVNGGTLDLNGFNLTMSSLSGTGGTVALGAAALTIDQATDTIYAGAVTGTGSLTKTGAGTLTLSGANTYTGATTVDSGELAVSGSIASSSITNNFSLRFKGTGTAGSATITNNFSLNFNDASTAGSATITNNNFGNVAFNESSTAGSATIINNNFGNVFFFDSSTGGSASIINSGFLDFSATSTAGSATITTNSGGKIGFDHSASGGTARFILNGTGLLDISLLMTGGTTAGSIEGAGSVFLGSKNLAVGGNNLSTTFSGVIQDGGFSGGAGGSLTKTGSGTLTLSGANTYTGGTTINAGTLAISADNNLGANTGGLTFSGGTLQFGASFDLANTRAITLNAGGGTFDTNGFNTTVSQAIGGTGALVKAGSGMLTLSGVNTYTGATTVEAGTLRAGTAGAFAGNTAYAVNGGTLDLNGFNLTMSSLSGTGGTVALGAAALAIDQATDTNYAGAVTGTGSLTKTGSGTLTLSGVNTYTGATSVDGGRLAVNGSITASSGVTVNNGGTLGGTGIVGNTTINGGTLAPGNSIGLLTVQGNLVLTAASRYMIEVSPVNADRVNVTGTANLGGATVNASFAAGSYVAKQYTIVNATSGLGGSTFGTFVNTNLPSGFKTSLSYDANNAYLDLALAFIAPPNTGLSGNQSGVGNALVNYFNRNGGIPLVYGGLTQAGLTQASGETATGGQQTTFNAMTQFMGMMTDPFTFGRGFDAPDASSFADDSSANSYASTAKSRAARDAYAMFSKAPAAQTYDPRWSVWASGFGGSQTTDGNAALGSNATTSRLFGTAVGADYRFSPNTIAGFALAGGGTNFSVTGGGSGRSDLFQAGAFVHHTVGAAYLSGALAYGWQDVTTDRTVTIAGVDRLRAAFNANAYSGRVEGGYRYVTPWAGGVGLTPYAAGQFTTFDLPAYAEQAISGANTFALAYGSKSVTDTRSELGLRADKSYAVQNAILTLRGRAAWAHDFNPDRTIGTTFQALPGASFVVNGARQASDSALTTASAEMEWINGWSAAATFEGEFSNVTRSYAGKGTVRYAW
ncbi:autotransporter-associated beta strand repeat-containing protein [Bradyrhizobium sp. LA6.1]|uniref:autotransporter outer membrane beta-barrel domain-containing protein n=1 Tax=Bradyrhizobium sp. LA6.1 TaxID=3156378 RepID=UPI003397103D